VIRTGEIRNVDLFETKRILGTPSLDARILQRILKKEIKKVIWFHLAQDREQWLSLVNTAMFEVLMFMIGILGRNAVYFRGT
jgi:hypothetical protein